MGAAPIPDLLNSWGITADELSEIVAENSSMRGLMFGFVAEYKLKKDWLMRPGIENVLRPRSHDRKQKCDFRFDYAGQDVTVEVKCLDTPKVKVLPNGTYIGTFQCNASDKTKVIFPDGSSLETNCLLVGGFDILAVCLHAFGKIWRFAFALNDELPRSTYRKYSPTQQTGLLKSSMVISWPLQPPYSNDLFSVLDRLLAKRAGR